MASSLKESIQKRSFLPSRPHKDDLPISQLAGAAAGAAPKIGLRRRPFSSFSVSIQPLYTSAAAASSAWAFRRSKSMSSIGELLAGGSVIRRWWEWGWGWILSRKPAFARDLEMNEQETAMLGFNSRGSWRHILHKLRSELRKMVAAPADQLPTSSQQSFSRCDSFSYAQQHCHEGNVSVY